MKGIRFYDAVSDLPACVYWQTLQQAFPEAKIILTARKSEDVWLKSWNEQAAAINGSKIFKIHCTFTPTGRQYAQFKRKTIQTTFDCLPTSYIISRDEQILRKTYREHNRIVQEKAPKDRLLVFNLSDGWKPLCKFLEKDIPDVSFPYSNKGSPFEDPSVAPLLFRRLDQELYFLISFLVIIVDIIIVFLFFNS
ncbi:uncharacterized protein LOC120338670 [Styela clava]